ncbi:unnamed protein product [Caenorhabditis auriculariae]|uniref:Uncharacterized protein n=1 Tax=Caenorhabditis auriculariae TaxID=2777116 RepID=A0A8S1HPW4_9PELO|nr:unnamed protein product [Caenorhabditis auriculariae]
MRISLLLLMLFGLKCFDTTGQNNEDTTAFVNASIDAHLNIHIVVGKSPNVSGQVTGYKIYFTRNADSTTNEYRDWDQEEVISDRPFYRITLDSRKYSIHPRAYYRIRSTVFLNHLQKAPVIVGTKVMHNSSVIISFVPGDDVDLVANYTLEYKEATSDHWNSLQFLSDPSGKVLLDGLESNKTYEVRMFVSGHIVPGSTSNSATFGTNTIELATVTLMPSENRWTMDPETSESLEILCDVRSSTPAQVYWKVNGERVSVDHSFYTITTTVHDEHVESTIRSKSRTRSAFFSCVATNSAGDAQKELEVVIKGPGSPPSAITLTAERNGYTIAWQPPSHPNGEITKYVVYHTLNREDPLSDWRKIDLDGSESFVRVITDTDESFYARVQAATDLGPGIISDIVAVERDTQPITVEMEYDGISGEQVHVVDPSQPLLVRCTARGKPRPSISFAISDHKNASLVEVDIWQRLQATASKPRTLPGSNYSTIELRVDKPGDMPTNVRVVGINSQEAIVIWDNPHFPNLPITSYIAMVSSDPEKDKSLWKEFETEAKDAKISRMSLPTQDLEKSTQYHIVVKARNAAGMGPSSLPATFTTPNGGPDDIPNDVRVEINEANQVVLRWRRPNSTTPISGYVLYYTRDMGLNNEEYLNWQSLDVNGDVLKYKFDNNIGLRPKTFYRLRAAAKNEHAVGPVSSVVEFETAYSELPIPTDIQTEINEDNTVHIRFYAVKDPDDQTIAVQKYRLEMAATEDVLMAAWVNVQPTQTVIDELTNSVDVIIDGSRMERNKMYWVKLTAVLNNPSRLVQSSKPRWFRTGSGKLLTTAKVEGGPVIEKEPNLSEKLHVTCSGEGIPTPTIFWSWQNVSVVNGSGGWEIHEHTREHLVVSNLYRNEISESGRLLCIVSNGEGNATDSTEIRVLGPGNPPARIQTTPFRNQINITWQEPRFPNGDIMKYIVYYNLQNDEDLSDWEKFETTDLEAQVDSKSPQTRHFVKIQAVSDRGPGIISDAVPCDSDLLYEPISLKLFADNIVEFEAEPDQNVNVRCAGIGKPVPDLFYKFDDNPEAEFPEIRLVDESDGVFEANAPLVSSPTNITVVCRAVNKYENVSIQRIIVIKRPGDAPSNITWSFSDEDESLFLDWSPVAHPNGHRVHYNLYLSNFKTKVAGPPVRIPEIPLNVNMTLRISAENEHGEGEKSAALIIPTPNGGPKTPPILTSLHAQDKTVHIQWTPPTKPNGQIQHYTIYYHRLGESVVKWHQVRVSAKETHAVLNKSLGLEDDVSYELKVSSTNAKNEGPASETYPFDLQTASHLPIVENFTATFVNSTIFVFLPDSEYEKYNVSLIHPNMTMTSQKVESIIGDDVTISVPFSLDVDLGYKVTIAGIKKGHESVPSEAVDLVFEKIEEDRSKTRSTSPDRRKPIREPPL